MSDREIIKYNFKSGKYGNYIQITLMMVVIKIYHCQIKKI